MAVRKLRPITPGQRFRVLSMFDEITVSRPEKSLVKPLKRTGGRNNKGRITAEHRGGGHKRAYRVVDFKRDKRDVPALVATIEYDPNRTAYIALLHYADGEKRYILAPHGLKVSDTVMAGERAEIQVGNCLPIKNIPLGTAVHNLEIVPDKGGQMVRGAGGAAQLLARDRDFVHVRLPSGEVRMFRGDCWATVGQVGNPDHESIRLGKAGLARWRGRRPRVRGVAMNPVDHPMGGGEGKSSGGRHPCSPKGLIAKGAKTRRRKPSDKLIVKKRK